MAKATTASATGQPNRKDTEKVQAVENTTSKRKKPQKRQISGKEQ